MAIDDIRPISELRDSGLLWLINRTTFHPQGFSLALDVDEATGDVTGWQLLGDGTEPWSFPESEDRGLFFVAHETLRQKRNEAEASIPPGPKHFPVCPGCGERHPD